MSDSEDLIARLQAAKAAKAAADAEFTALDEAEAPVDAVALAERAAKDSAALLDARKRLGARGKAWDALDTDLGVVVVKRAHPVSFKKFQSIDGTPTLEDVEILVRPCVDYPDLAAFDRYQETQPAILTRSASLIAKLAGARKDELRGKS